MEARSLASLNYLAANPPQYPQKPTEDRLDPLTLYISRVPGTRDVILSPFKPQIKSVTVEDVASSLYYVHFDTSAPELGAPGPIRAEEQGRSSSEGSYSSSMNIPRKPLPEGSRPQTPDSFNNSASNLAIRPESSHRREAPPAALDPTRPAHDQLRPPPSYTHPMTPVTEHSTPSYDSPQFPRTHPPAPGYPNAGPPTEAPARKPLGPRPLNNASGGLAGSAPHPDDDPRMPMPARKPVATESVQSGHILPQRPIIAEPEPVGQPIPTRRPVGTADARQSQEYFARRPAGTRTRSPSPRKSSEAFTLNLIRRDPSSGHQWNVGKIASGHAVATAPFQREDRGVQSGSSSSAAATRQPIDIQIETSGYQKFRNMPARKSFDAAGPHINSAAAAVAAMEDMQANQPAVQRFFSRQVVMSYSKSWSSQIKEKLHRLDKGRDGRLRSHSASSTDHRYLSADASTEHPGPGMKPRGYVFSSPWDGRCEFRTGNGGRSVRLHHTIHTGSTAAYNPLVADSSGSSPPDDNSSSVIVSELRFNLPMSETLPPGDDQQQRGHGHQRLGSLAKFWRRGSEAGLDEDDDDGEVSPFDINLGRERAGGGNRGSRAKLGKLIITHDGLKMLDLVVAANVGLWWTAWEKNF